LGYKSITSKWKAKQKQKQIKKQVKHRNNLEMKEENKRQNEVKKQFNVPIWSKVLKIKRKERK
jgi:hypothetical protein